MSNAVAVKRQTNIDLLRITASFFVVLIHVACAYWGWCDMYQQGWTGIAVYATFTRVCVPLFVMISGKLFLARNNAVPISKLLLNYVLKLVVLYIVWGLLYAIDDLGVNVLLSKDWIDIPKHFATSPKYHLWYLPMQTLIYLMLPLFWALAKHEQGKYLGYVCAIICAFSVINATLKLFVPMDTYVSSFLGKYYSGLDVYWLYFLLGYYVSTKKLDKLKTWHCLMVFVISMTIATVYTAWSSRTNGGYDNRLLESYPITTFVATIALFLAFQKMPCNFSQRTGKIISVVSRCTLFVYLLHPFVLDRLSMLGLNAVTFNPWICCPVVAAIVFVLCMIPALVLTKIPFVNKWLL